MTPRTPLLLLVLASTACFSPEPIAGRPGGSTGTTPDPLADAPESTGAQSGPGSGETTDDGTSTGGESTGGEDAAVETTDDSPESLESSSSGDDGSAESSSGGAAAMETCFDFDFDSLGYACRSGRENHCEPEPVNEMQAACEACTNAPCEQQSCSLPTTGVTGTIWTPRVDGGSHIEEPMAFVDSPVPRNIVDMWPRGTILLDGCSGDRIGEVEL